MEKRVSGKTGTGLSWLALLPAVALVWGVAVAGGCAWWALPAALCGAGLCILLPGCALLYALKRLTPLPQGFELLLTALLVVYALCWETATAHPAAVGQTVLKQDFLWNIGNARSFWLGFPPQDIRFAGVRLHYHYLNELLSEGKYC